MGLTDLCSFNLAMLGKEVWRIIHIPNALFSRFLKSKYFPNCDILEAIPKSNASYTWKSMCGDFRLIHSGVRWRIGDGRMIKVWEDNGLTEIRV